MTPVRPSCRICSFPMAEKINHQSGDSKGNHFGVSFFVKITENLNKS